MKKGMNEYLRRNISVAKAEGARAAIQSILDHLSTIRNRPRWLTSRLFIAREKLRDVPKELAAYRDEVSPT